MTGSTSLQQSADPRIEQLAHDGELVRLVQITDSHLCENSGGTLLGMDTDHSLQSVIDRVRSDGREPDILLLTGDLADRGSVSAYRRVDAYARQLTDQNFWLPGNHDSREQMEAAQLPVACLSTEIRVGNWQILMLDSQLPGEVGGELGAAQLILLENALQQGADENLHALVCLHHQPVAIGCAWLDKQMVADAGSFFEIIDRYSAVKGILWGHIHQQIDRQRNGVALIASPSTCVQFAPDSELFKVDDLSPGYRWLDLGADGAIDTGVSRVEGVQFTVDLDSRGYQ
jgi:Icc protein